MGRVLFPSTLVRNRSISFLINDINVGHTSRNMIYDNIASIEASYMILLLV
jgi:hypothetical protein